MRISKLVNVTAFSDPQLQPKNLQDMDLQSPASYVLKEAGQDKGLKLKAGLAIELARTILTETNRLTAVVVDKQGAVVGLVSLADLESVKVLTVAARLGLLRNELVLRDLMTPVSGLSCISYTASTRVTVGEVVQTLQQASKPYLLVLDGTDNSLIGYFSAQDIAHKLGVSIPIELVPKTFNEVVNVVSNAH